MNVWVCPTGYEQPFRSNFLHIFWQKCYCLQQQQYRLFIVTVIIMCFCYHVWLWLSNVTLQKASHQWEGKFRIKNIKWNSIRRIKSVISSRVLSCMLIHIWCVGQIGFIFLKELFNIQLRQYSASYREARAFVSEKIDDCEDGSRG